MENYSIFIYIYIYIYISKGHKSSNECCLGSRMCTIIYESPTRCNNENNINRIAPEQQPPTPMRTDNNTASRIMNNTVKKLSKTMDTHFFIGYKIEKAKVCSMSFGDQKKKIWSIITQRNSLNPIIKTYNQYIYTWIIEVQKRYKGLLKS